MYWVIETDGPPLAVTGAVRQAIAGVDPGVPVSFVRSMDQWLGNTLAARRFNLQLVGVFALAALLLAVVGVYAVSAAAVAARTREIGIRAALGASRRQVVALVLTSGLRLVFAGLAAGSVAALVCGAALSGMLFGVPPWRSRVARYRRHDARRRGACRERRRPRFERRASIRSSRCGSSRRGPVSSTTASSRGASQWIAGATRSARSSRFAPWKTGLSADGLTMRRRLGFAVRR